MSNGAVTINKIPLAVAADNFAAICHAIDNGDLNETLVALFHETRLDLSAAVDRRLCCLQLCSTSLEAAKGARDAWRERVKQLEFVEERIKGMTIEAIQITGMKEVKGETGRLCLQQNPEALSLEFMTHEMTVNRVIDPNDLERWHIPEKYLKKVAAFQLDTKQIKEDVQAGETYPWCKLTRGVHLRSRV